VVGSERLQPEPIAVWQARFQGRIQLINAYGPTETTVTAVAHGFTAAFTRVNGQWPAVPIGRPLANLQARVLDRFGRPVPRGVVGQLHLAGPGLAFGYLHQPALTAAAFRPDPFAGEPGTRLYASGDLVRMDAEQRLTFMGRADHQIKIRGFRIELGEIEAQLDAHPEVQAAVVTATSGEIPRLVAFFTAEHGPAPAALRDFMAARLPDYMVPHRYIALRTMPKLPSGKIDRARLARRADSLSQQNEAPRPSAPRSATEAALVEIWRDVLGATVGIHDDFFQRGGHSLLAIRILARIRRTFAVELPLRALFEAPRLSQLAARIEAERGAGGEKRPPLKPLARSGPQPLSFAQQRLWFLDRLEPNATTYNLPGELPLGGPLDVSALERALTAVVTRQQSLRTTFTLPLDREEPVQIVGPVQAVQLPVIDLSGLAADQRGTVSNALVRAEHGLPFDLERGPLMRVRLLRLDAETHSLALTLHHIISDGWSMDLLNREVRTAYDQSEAGDLSPLRVQYADYATWQRDWLAGDVLEAELAFWRATLAGAPALTTLPLDRPRPAVQRFEGAAVVAALPVEHLAILAELARAAGATRYMTLLALFKVLLARYAGQEDLVVGTPVAGRPMLELEPLIGFFVNTLVLRTQPRQHLGFTDFLARVRNTVLAARDHDQLPFERLVEDLQPERTLQYSPVFQVLFNYQHLETLPQPAGPDPGEDQAVLAAQHRAAKFDLSLAILDDGQRARAVWRFNTDLFAAESIQRMAGHFSTLLRAVSTDAHTPLAHLPLMDAAQRARLLQHCTGPAIERPAATVLEQFSAQAQARGEAVALVDEAKQLSYAALSRRARAMADHLRRAGAGPDRPVALCLPRSTDMIAAVLAVMAAGAAYLPLDPELPPARRDLILSDAGVRLMITHLETVADGITRVAPDSTGTAAAPVATHPDQLAYIIYTSGSTGLPKGVAVSHGALAHYTAAVRTRLDHRPDHRYALASTIAADLGLTMVYPALTSGGCLHVLSRDRVTRARAFSSYMSSRAIDFLKIVPSHLAALSEDGHATLPRRQLVLGGEASPWPWIRDLHRAAPGTAILNHYGPSEATVGVLTHAFQPGEAPPAYGNLVLGRALPGCRILIATPHLEPQPAGVFGELLIGGPGLARGYTGLPARTAAAFIPDPFTDRPGQRLYRTGDAARALADGRIEFLGRIDFQIKIRGYRVEPGEVEAALRADEAVAEAVVLALPGADDGTRLVA
jgi:amino acid adenylation domain-containing protein